MWVFCVLTVSAGLSGVCGVWFSVGVALVGKKMGVAVAGGRGESIPPAGPSSGWYTCREVKGDITSYVVTEQTYDWLLGMHDHVIWRVGGARVDDMTRVARRRGEAVCLWREGGREWWGCGGCAWCDGPQSLLHNIGWLICRCVRIVREGGRWVEHKP